MIQDYSQKLKIKKQKQNIIIIISIKKQYKKERKSYSIEFFLCMRKLKKEIILTTKTKICQIKIEKEKRNI